MNRQLSRGLTALGAALGLVLSSFPVLAPPAAAKSLPDLFEVGRDQSHEPCTASRDWSRTPAGIKSEADQAFVLSCRGVSAARLQGIVLPASAAAAAAAQRQCGAETPPVGGRPQCRRRTALL